MEPTSQRLRSDNRVGAVPALKFLRVCTSNKLWTIAARALDNSESDRFPSQFRLIIPVRIQSTYRRQMFQEHQQIRRNKTLKSGDFVRGGSDKEICNQPTVDPSINGRAKGKDHD